MSTPKQCLPICYSYLFQISFLIVPVSGWPPSLALLVTSSLHCGLFVFLAVIISDCMLDIVCRTIVCVWGAGVRGPANFLCHGPGNKYFELREPHRFLLHIILLFVWFFFSF